VFLIEDKRPGMTTLVFTWEHPRRAGYRGDFVEGVTLEYDMLAVHSWPDGHARPEACVGRAPDNPKHYKVFKYRSERQAAGYEPVAGSPAVFGSWKDYLKLRHAEDLPDEDWYQELDRYDEASRLRRQRAQAPAPPVGKSRDDVAAWVARRHLLADSGIREVWYLPGEAPPEEIRLLEVNDRLAVSESKAEAIDFGLDVEGVRFRLFVADITSEQLDQIKQDPSRLPPGWSLKGSRIWRRGA
jgi:hypothetical protein